MKKVKAKKKYFPRVMLKGTTTKIHKDKSKYSRKIKHKGGCECSSVQ